MNMEETKEQLNIHLKTEVPKPSVNQVVTEEKEKYQLNEHEIAYVRVDAIKQLCRTRR